MNNARVAIIGSGVSGTTVADILIKRGAASQVVIFEAGPDVPVMNYRLWLDYLTTNLTPYRHCVDLKDEIDGNENLFQVRGSRLFVVGGSTRHWGGWCPRFKPEDFELESRTGYGRDWPISYEELVPFYSKAEHRLEVAGDSSRTNPPRIGAQYPIPAVSMTQKDGLVVDAFKKLGFQEYGSLPIARNKRCVTNGTCRYCRFGGRYEASISLGILQSENNVEVRPLTPVTEIVMDSKRRARGIKFYDVVEGEEKVEDFDYVIVCGGAIESAKLLLRSVSRFWPNGIGNDTGHLGAHLIAHPSIIVTGELPINPNAVEQELDFPTLECREFDTPSEQKLGGKMYFVRDGRRNRVDLARELIDGATPDELEIRLEGPVKYQFYGLVEEYESPVNRVELAPGTTQYRLPKTRVLYKTPDVTTRAKRRHIKILERILKTMGVSEDAIYSEARNPVAYHTVGTCRMSISESDGVVDRDLRVHDTDNIFVVSSASFPTVAAANPTLTLVAIATRAAEIM